MAWYQGWGFWYNSPDGSINTATQTVKVGEQGSTATTPPTTATTKSTQSTTTAPKSEPTPGTTAGDLSAKAAINSTLAMYGLSSLADFAWKEYLKDIPVEQIMLDIRKTPEYKARFPAMATLSASGHAITEQEYIDYEQGAISLMKSAGLPKGFYDQPADFAGFLTNGIALPELQDRIDMARQAVYKSDPETLSELKAWYGIEGGLAHIGAATAYFLDPVKALPAIEKQFISAQEGGAALRAGYAGLTQSEAERLYTLGIDPTKAGEGFGTLAHLEPLFANLPGEAGATPTHKQGLEATFENDAAAAKAVSDVADRRKAVFQAGGAFMQTSEGITGL